ncbi:MAG: PAS domain S-box protein [bacterium]|nr:PAS domain S-box protein [bacterium]
MFESTDVPSGMSGQRLLTALAIALVVALLTVSLFSYLKSRSDSLDLLVAQGTAFTESLAQASENAIASETVYDRLVQARYSDLAASLRDRNLESISEQELVTLALTHDLMGIYLYDSTAGQVTGVVARGPHEALSEYVEAEVSELLQSPESNYVLLLEEGETPGETVHYYLEVTSRLDRVIVLAVDALYYTEALRQTGIGYLAQNMAREKGVSYIIYQSTDGIIFASTKPGDVLAIESDSFLTEALESDSIMYRELQFQEGPVLELVRPFSSAKYPFGLFRVGLSLDAFRAVEKAADRRMLAQVGSLLALLIVALLYFRGRRKRLELRQRFSDMKSITDQIFEQMDTGVVAVDASGVISLANRAFEEIFAVEAVRGKLWSDTIKDHASVVHDFVAGSRKTDETEVSISTDEGVRVLLLARSKLAGDTASVVMVVYDITRLKEFERASARKERLSEMGDLAAGVAHEIRNPLNAISIAAQRLATEFKPQDRADEYRSFTQQIRDETSRLNDIITRFLALSRVDRKKQREIQLDSLLREIGELLKVEGDRVGLNVAVEVESGIQVKADPDRFKQVFLNFFNNSKEALVGKAGSFSIIAQRDSGQVRIAVADTGPGIASESREKLFAPYFTTKEAGTGLGLSTVQRIVSEMGGDIHLNESYTGGAMFVITLPAVPE